MTSSDNETTIVQEETTEPVKITKSDALKKYMLRAKDLEGLNLEVRTIKKYGKNLFMTLFLESDILARAIERWGSEDGIQREKTKRELRRTKLREDKLNKLKKLTDSRRQELSTELEKVGLHLRDDSKLCNQWIEGTLDDNWTLPEIVQMSQMMNWLHTSTDYQKRLDEFFLHKNEMKGDEYYDRDEYKEFIQDQIDEIRREIIKEHGGGTPWVSSKI